MTRGPDVAAPRSVVDWLLSLVPRDAEWFGLADLYKSIHQSYCGPGHAIPSRAAAEARLLAEWEGLGDPMPDETLIEHLRPGAAFVRVHLRPYRKRGGACASVLEAFLRSASTPTDESGFAVAWRVAGGLAGEGRLPFPAAAFAKFDRRLRAAGYPAVHHSPEFERIRRPAYRLVDAAEGALLESGLMAL